MLDFVSNHVWDLVVNIGTVFVTAVFTPIVARRLNARGRHNAGHDPRRP